MDTLGAENNLAMYLYAGDMLSRTPLRLKVFHSAVAIPLSSSLPMLEHMGVKVLEQLEYKVEPEGTPLVYVHDFGMSHAGDIKLDVTQVKSGFEEAFARAWRGEIENDDFNRLVLRANLGWREVTILRAYSKYLRQAGLTFSQAYMGQELAGNPALVPGLPEPKPMFEIYVYSPRVEGVHLRGGKVARGGLRWSDRMEDFRTEVLGLMKAQMVKNTVIVPVGSKGGFVVKQPPADRDAFMKEVVTCYQTCLRGLLDLTANLVAVTI